jgi:hypothetical protein
VAARSRPTEPHPRPGWTRSREAQGDLRVYHDGVLTTAVGGWKDEAPGGGWGSGSAAVQSAVTSVTAALAEDSSTIPLRST